MRKICTAIIALALSLVCGQAFAQMRTVSGIVSSEEGVEVGVYVYDKANQNNAVMTLEDGSYSIQLDGAGTLVFSMIGFKTVEIPVSATSKVVNVTLEVDASFLDEVIVVGYGTRRKEMLVGSVSQVTSKDLMKAPTSNVSNLIVGRLSGVTAIQRSGIPGNDGAALSVRGLATFNDSSPLVLIDGVVGSINNVNPNDVASISVLKDAATAAIYGVRGAGGVILVTTKSGGEGNTKISYDGSVSFTQNTAQPVLCNAEQFIHYHNLAREMDGLAPYWTDETISWMKEKGIYAETDWQKQIYNNFGLQHQHNISATGGTKKLRYYTSVGIMDQDGILKNTDYQRINVRSNVDAKIADGLSFTLNIAGNTSEQNLPGYSINPVAEFNPITAAYFALPVLATEYEGLPLVFNHGTYYRSPLSSLTESGYQRTRSYRLETQGKLEYDFAKIAPLKGLKASVFLGYDFSFTQNLNFMHSHELYMFSVQTLSIDKRISQGIPENNFNKSASYGWNYILRPQIDYNRKFGKHDISAVLLYEQGTGYSDTMTAWKKGYFTDFPVDLSLGMAQGSTQPSGSHRYRSALQSFAGRVDYAFDEKYLVGLTMRADGSSKFAPGHRWGYFPSVALGWVMSKENFFKPVAGTVDFMKLKTSIGVLGADDTDDDIYRQIYRITDNSMIIGGQPRPSFYSGGYVHEDLTWSRTTVYNVGLETKMFGNKLSIDADVFYKYTSRILEYDGTGVYSPSLGGNYPTWMNSGRMDDRGFELTVRHDNWFSNGLTYNITGILSYSHNRVLSRRLSDGHPSYRAILGEPMGSFYGFHALGLFQTEEEVLSWPTAPTGYLQPGAIKYADINGDGQITSGADYVKIGRSQFPEMTFSFNTEVSYKGFTLSMLFQGATLCNYMLSGAYNNTTDNTMFTRAFYGDGNSVLYLVEDAWRPDNTDARYPRLSTVTNANNAWASDWWVVDGSYLRLKNAQLSYSIPTNILKKIGDLQRLTVYVAGTNLFTISAFKYLDPENPGITNGYYPQQKTFSVGLNLTF